jgi:hypothetical protein
MLLMRMVTHVTYVCIHAKTIVLVIWIVNVLTRGQTTPIHGSCQAEQQHTYSSYLKSHRVTDCHLAFGQMPEKRVPKLFTALPSLNSQMLLTPAPRSAPLKFSYPRRRYYPIKAEFIVVFYNPLCDYFILFLV